MARKFTKNEGTKYIVTVVANPDFCGVDACGVHFAHGQAEITNDRAAAWFEEHDGYKVEKVKEEKVEEEKVE